MHSVLPFHDTDDIRDVVALLKSEKPTFSGPFSSKKSEGLSTFCFNLAKKLGGGPGFPAPLGNYIPLLTFLENLEECFFSKENMQSFFYGTYLAMYLK